MNFNMSWQPFCLIRETSNPGEAICFLTPKKDRFAVEEEWCYQ